jgi:galactan endo-1,6-beta-galactosidase
MCTHFPLATLSGLALLAGLALATTGSSARADTTVRPLPDKTWVTWEGFGASLAWWANQFGARDDLADTAFTTRTVRLATDSGTYNVPGLGLNIARYNIGGTSNAPAGGAHADIPATMPAFKQIQGFWLDWTSDDPASASFDWNVDATQRAMLKKAAARGADRIEASSDAPMWWMLYNHSTAGSATGGDNLQSWNYQAFAKYLATVARYARDNWGVDFETVEAFNEPSAWWWKYPSSQEGCHFDIATQKQILAYLRQNAAMAQDILRRSIAPLAARKRNCGCTNALQFAIVTDPAQIPQKVKSDLKPIIGRYIQ